MFNNKRKTIFRAIFFILWFFLFCYSFLNNTQKNIQLSQWNIIFVLDVSNSMNVSDVFYNYHQTSRLELAKQIIANNVKLENMKFGLIVFSNKFKYFIPPTFDKTTFLVYLDTINTNILNWWKSNFVNSLNWLKTVLNVNDSLIILSDFDTKENLPKVDLSNYIYAICIWTKRWWIVKDANWRTMYHWWKILNSSVSYKNIWLKWSYYHYTNYKKWQILPFLDKFRNKNLIKKIDNLGVMEIISFLLIIFAFFL